MFQKKKKEKKRSGYVFSDVMQPCVCWKFEIGISGSEQFEMRKGSITPSQDGSVNGINESYKGAVEKEAYKEANGVTSSKSPTIFLLNYLDNRILWILVMWNKLMGFFSS